MGKYLCNRGNFPLASNGIEYYYLFLSYLHELLHLFLQKIMTFSTMKIPRRLFFISNHFNFQGKNMGMAPTVSHPCGLGKTPLLSSSSHPVVTFAWACSKRLFTVSPPAEQLYRAEAVKVKENPCPKSTSFSDNHFF